MNARIDWRDMTWLVVLNGCADRWLYWFESDEWKFRNGQPAGGTLALLPRVAGGPRATIDDAVWAADVIAFDHDAPVGVQPTYGGHLLPPLDSDGLPKTQPIVPLPDHLSSWFWENLNGAYQATAELRFNDSYVMRYDNDEPRAPSTNFRQRFGGRENLVALYAMAARQPDPLMEYLCLYRLLEAADQTNGKDFARNHLDDLLDRDFGDLYVVPLEPGPRTSVHVFESYKARAQEALLALREARIADVPRHLYEIRNSLAHGKAETLSSGFDSQFTSAIRALPLVKLLARVAVAP